jgi:hypothetical protein
LVLLVLRGQLALFRKELGVVASEFLERDQEVAEYQFKAVLICVGSKETINEVGDLGSVYDISVMVYMRVVKGRRKPSFIGQQGVAGEKVYIRSEVWECVGEQITDKLSEEFPVGCS